jgi:hypothetical protein
MWNSGDQLLGKMILKDINLISKITYKQGEAFIEN